MTYNRFIQGLKPRRRRGRPQDPRRAGRQRRRRVHRARRGRQGRAARGRQRAQGLGLTHDASRDRGRSPDCGQRPRQGGPEAQPPLGTLRAAALPCRGPAGRPRAPSTVPGCVRRGVRHRRPPPSSTPTSRRPPPPWTARRRPRARRAQRHASPRQGSSASAASSTCRWPTLRRPHAARLVADLRRRPRPRQRRHRDPLRRRRRRRRVVLAGDSVDPYNAKTVRASVGSLFHLPVAVEPDAGRGGRALPGRRPQVLAADGAGEVDLDDADDAARRADRLAVRQRGVGPARRARRAGRPPGPDPDPRPRREPQPRHRRRVCLYASARAQRRYGAARRAAPAGRRA